VHSYGRYAHQRLQERPDTDFVIGLKIFPTLVSGPSPLALTRDLELVDSIGAEALSVYITPAAVTAAALDSIAHSLEEERADKPLLLALDLSREKPLAAAERDRYLAARVRDVARIVGRLHPEYVVPVLDPNGAAAHALGQLSLGSWIRYLSDAAVAARRARSGTLVMAHVGGFGARDSALYAWAASSSSVDAVGVSLFPSLGGAATLDARMRTVDSWLRASRSTKEHWVLEAGALPMVHGDASQDLAVRGILAWATSRNAIKGLIINEASDYEAPLGLRTPSGRLRPAAATAAAAIRELGENRPS
jgi:hypothetical protein